MKKETKTATRKSEFVKRGIVILLVCAMLLLLPGVSSFALSAAEFVREHSTKAAAPTDRGGLSGLHSSGETTEDEEWLLGEAPSGIVLSVTDSQAGIQTLTLASSAGAPDMSGAMRRSYPVFSIQNSTNEYVDIHSGSLKLTYELANLQGVNGMDLSLSVSYDSSDAHNVEKGYSDYETYMSEYAIFYRIGVEYRPEQGEGFFVFSEQIFKESFSSMLDFNTRLNEIMAYREEHTDVLNGISYTVTTQYYIQDAGEQTGYRYYSTTTNRISHAAMKGLPLGWHFNIPYIETVPRFNENNELDDSHKVLMLDTGESFNLVYYTFDESTEDWLLGEQYQTSQYYWWGTTDRESFEQTGTIQIDCSDGGGDEKRNGNTNMWMAKYYTLPNSNNITLNYKVTSDNPTGAMLKVSLYANGKYYVLFDWNVARNELNNTTNSVNLQTLDPNVDWANTKVTVFFEARDGGNNNGVGEACSLDYFETVAA